jgi:hypothetical protein
LRLGKATRLIAVRRPLPTRRNPTLPTRPVRPTPTLPTDRLNLTNPTPTSWTPRLGLTNGRRTRHLPIRPLMTLRLAKPSLSPTYPRFRHRKPFAFAAVTANTPSRQACSPALPCLQVANAVGVGRATCRPRPALSRCRAPCSPLRPTLGRRKGRWSAVKTRVPTTFTGRKRWEAKAWRLTQKVFEQHGFQVTPLGLNRSLLLPQAEPLILSAPSPPMVLMLLCAPDAIAYHAPTQRSYLTYRSTFSVRACDFVGLLMRQAALMCRALAFGRGNPFGVAFVGRWLG